MAQQLYTSQVILQVKLQLRNILIDARCEPFMKKIFRILKWTLKVINHIKENVNKMAR